MQLAKDLHKKCFLKTSSFIVSVLMPFQL